jgi:MFS family permease
VKVPRAQRRGLLARVCFIDEITSSFDYSTKMKWTITAIVAVAGAAAPMGSAIVLPALVDITRDFNSTPTVVNLSVAMYMLSMSIFPLWWSSFSETLGRRTIYVVSFFLFLVFNVVSALSTSIGMFIVMRV